MKTNRKFLAWIIVAIVLAFLPAGLISAQTNEEGFWPKEIAVDEGRVIMYQPQPEKLDGNILESRAAVSLEFGGDVEPVFGAIWYDTRLYTDRDARKATIADVHVKHVRFPDQTEENAQKMKALLEREIPRWNLVIDMDRLLATLDLAEKRDLAAQGIRTDPPEIIFVPEPAILVTIDGEPRMQNIENSNLMRVNNTPFTILFSLGEKKYYLYAGNNTWYVSNAIKDNWRIAGQVPSEVAAMAPKLDEKSGAAVSDDLDLIQSGPPPAIFVSTVPAELISSTGSPEYTPIDGTDLLYMSNTDSDVLLHIMDKHYYVLLSGRWYRSVSLQGPWEYVAGEDLPADFAQIPEDSQMGTVLYAVPGTDVAQEAVLDAYIPQTAAVDPNRASLVVEYDGKPKFEQIGGTHLYYAVNTATPVIWEGKGYYACDQAVWFVAPSPRGPWMVATSVPDTIYLIPPDSPMYNVTFVRVYQATPEVVYVGYTPGYTNTYIYHNTIVYGTGYYWPGWYGQYYYPRNRTWGYHARWNPWYGWGFGISYGDSPFYFSLGFGDWYRGGWWGPSHYRHYRYGYSHRYRYENHVGYQAGYIPDGPRPGGNNVYRSKQNKLRLLSIHDRPFLRTTVPRRENNVYVDREGNVHRKTDEGWQTRKKDKWLQGDGGNMLKTRPATGPLPIQRPKDDNRGKIVTRPATGPVSIQRPKDDNRGKIVTRPATGPVSIQRPKDDNRGKIETRPATGPVSIQRPKDDNRGKIVTRPATGPVSIQRPKDDNRGKIETRPDTGPAPIQKQQNFRLEKRTQQQVAPQLDQSYKARQQGENRAESFKGTIGSKGGAPPQEIKGIGGKHR